MASTHPPCMESAGGGRGGCWVDGERTWGTKDLYFFLLGVLKNFRTMFTVLSNVCNFEEVVDLAPFFYAAKLLFPLFGFGMKLVKQQFKAVLGDNLLDKWLFWGCEGM